MSIDVHCHHLAFSPKNGGHIHPKFSKSYRIRWYLNAIGVLNWQDAFLGRMPEKERLDERYRELLVARLDASPLGHAVVLAFDGVYDANGFFEPERTAKAVTNDAVIALCKESPKMLFGASVNPLRRDWRYELDKCLDAGAVLVKWLPNVMGFDPGDVRIEPFYQRLRETGTPILMHVGFEYAVPNINIRFSGLDRLEAALRAGVTVIAAHCCGGRIIYDSPSLFRDMRTLVAKYPNLYLDVAALASFHRKSRFLNALRDPLVASRLVFGTDYPIPVHAWAFRKETAGRTIPENYFAKDLFIKEATGLEREALTRGYAPIKKRLLIARPETFHQVV
ncbi:MAG: hypothetical protein A3C93_03295 [Candidatus Lloydbacteria bacterium RIFCSPHIGHO2_02_FULL_54_17]|uniref:Amidohydrolase-related domain-containing protein n=1 Tax=Candidatus Lloydbacteria bacterium RIFCSPHIGHO2_02_FULL_54_17 TaxID=1798664 RepID=A0A1G2DHG4_9BACT|nr:MAG: hypothetical protein A3C93_03295 [Candidatus Lloydbacteria bacterium RIFCSPHIGHO2_02_FULL_54_17]OGZ14867.1 MAG: hypothetical protein A2948_02280 [Candidatus Lloydbacteria bacterium RIFCSPLOWO2_01_FULL_54_18]OGZ16869.1 MAG: hypothetical protein A3H76_01085 [Candidatus Lloydbacteria bacterium RIFCSPLOWO2_02_FULL_54_12]